MTQRCHCALFLCFKEVKFVYKVEDEAQRYGRNKDTIINSTYINSGEYRRKFDAISDSPELNRLLYQLAKKMLLHRSGRLYEDMYWIDLNTLKIVAEETRSELESEIVYSTKTKEEILKYDNLLTIHSHPNSFPPSDADLYANYIHGYSSGIVVCHNGEIYKYRADEEISLQYYSLIIAKYKQRGYNENVAIMKAYDEIQVNFKIKVEEVINNGTRV